MKLKDLNVLEIIYHRNPSLHCKKCEGRGECISKHNEGNIVECVCIGGDRICIYCN